jgi:hypothetical protein
MADSEAVGYGAGDNDGGTDFEPPVFGLGYSSFHSQHDVDGDDDGGERNNADNNNNNNLLQNYSYYGPSMTTDEPTVAGSSAPPPSLVVSSSDTTNSIIAANTRTTAANVSSSSTGFSQSSASIEAEIERGRSRALDIVSQFQHQAVSGGGMSTYQSPGAATPAHHHSNPDSVLSHLPLFESPPIISPEEYAEKRRACFEWLGNRKNHSLLKNLEYVARREEERMHGRLQQIQQAQAYEQQIEDQYQQRLQYLQQQRLQQQHQEKMDGKNNLGSKNERQGKRKTQSSSSSSTVAIYISGLPVGLSEFSVYSRGAVSSASTTTADDDHNTFTSTEHQQSPTQLKNVLDQLFGSFGKLRKIHVYTQKDTGLWKGDALAIYENPRSTTNYTSESSNNTNDTHDNDGGDNDVVSSFVDMVCSQVRRASVVASYYHNFSSWMEIITMRPSRRYFMVSG